MQFITSKRSIDDRISFPTSPIFQYLFIFKNFGKTCESCKIVFVNNKCDDTEHKQLLRGCITKGVINWPQETWWALPSSSVKGRLPWSLSVRATNTDFRNEVFSYF